MTVYGKRGAYEPFFAIFANGEELPEKIMKNITKAVFEDNEEKLDELSFSVLDKDFTLQDAPELAKDVELLFVFGYVGNLQRRLCKIEQVEYNLPENGVPTIEVKALDKGIDLVKNKPRACYGNVYGADVIMDIAARHKLKCDLYIPDDFYMDNVSQGGKSDMDFAKEIAVERGCSVWVENATLVVKPYTLDKSSLKLIYHQNLISLRATYNGGQGEAERNDTKVVGIDPDKKELVTEENTKTEPSQNEDGEVVRNVGDKSNGG